MCIAQGGSVWWDLRCCNWSLEKFTNFLPIVAKAWKHLTCGMVLQSRG